MVERTSPSFKHLDTSAASRRCTELIIPMRSCRPRDLIQTHRNVTRIKGYISVMENLNRSVNDLKCLKTAPGISTAEQTKMLNHCKHWRKPTSPLDAILRTTPHGSMAVILAPSENDAVASITLLDRWFKLLSRFTSRCKDKTGCRNVQYVTAEKWLNHFIQGSGGGRL